MARYCEGCGHPLADNTAFCDKCGRKTAQATGACRACGAPIATGEAFCRKCGAAQAQPAQRPQAQRHQASRPQAPRPQAPAQPAWQAAPASQPQKKSRAGLFVGFGIAAVALVALVLVGGAITVYVLSRPKATPGPDGPVAPQSRVELRAFPDELKVDPANVKVNCSYLAPDTIIPANYRSLDYIVYMQCWTDSGKTSVLVSVEIPEFTQKYEQKIDVSRAETELIIHPPMLEGAAGKLNTSKDAQLIVSVKDMNSGKVILQDTKAVKLYSRYDMQWSDRDGTPYYENILAWVTPEAHEIDYMLRDTADSIYDLTGGKTNSLVGYQSIGSWSEAQITYAQVCSMMYTLAYRYNVKYVMAPFSSTDSSLQSIKTPAQVINNQAGLCIETAVTLASAVQRANMHAVIILLPGHAQVAVETWHNSGEYLLIETTALDAARASKFDNLIWYLTKDEWTEYLAQDGYVVIDCALAQKLNIKSID